MISEGPFSLEPAIGINATAISSSREQKYSTKIRGVFYYTRTIPQDVRDLDPRPNPVQKSLNTKNLDIAMSRRDMLQQCDDRFWRWLRGSKVPFQQPSELAAAGEDIKDLFGTDDLPFTPPPPQFSQRRSAPAHASSLPKAAETDFCREQV
ncbi:DUF6538 domain-containing protein [uncultured Cohaesibacter sp.]|uniref:DUF6538 domain-containing protein n=1 Tax=uncultured Cohaesibacter sp. TaxID=1002546 RepID=UPI0029C8159A|nr:DUF6538 domain-containing protein [uncultured Cohaesibacter sp.]